MSVQLKPLTKEYLSDYVLLLNDLDVQRRTAPYQPVKTFTPDELLPWLEKIQNRDDRRDFAIVRSEDNAFVGEIVLNEFVGESANIRLALMSRFQGKGYGKSAMQLALEYAAETLKLKEITLSVFDCNHPGLALYRKLGFETTGTGEYQGHRETYMRIKLNRKTI